MSRAARTDLELVRAYRAGDERAFAALHDRHRPALERFAKRLLASSAAADAADDVVQEAFLRASRALRRDPLVTEVRGWLFRVVRNCCLDEIGRAREATAAAAHADPADLPLAGPAASDPATAQQLRSRVRETLGDIAALPARQRHALVRTTLDGVAHADVAVELGMSEQATKSLVHRARTSLASAAVARDTACADVHADLLTAFDAKRRASARTYRHLAGCAGCRAFRASLRVQDRALGLMAPLPALLAGALGVKVVVAGKAGGAAKPAVATLAVAGAATAAGTQVFLAGDPAPERVRSAVLAQTVQAGRPLPAGTAVVRRAVRLAAAPAGRRPVALTCPRGMRAADLLPVRGAAISAQYTPEVRVGIARTVRVVFDGRRLPAEADASVGVLCRTPARGGGIVALDPRRRGALTRTARATTTLRAHADRAAAPLGTVLEGQRLAPLARRGGWLRVRTDLGQRGWVPAGTVARLG